MPLSELLYRLGKEKFDSSQEKNTTDLSSVPENDFVELVWENGQIQSSRGRKIQNSSGIQSHTNKLRDKEISNGSNTKMGRFGAVESVLDEVPMSVPSVEMGLNQDDDMVPWLNYPIDDSLQQDYCHEFFSELSGVTVNEQAENGFASLDKRTSSNQSVRDSPALSMHNGLSLEQRVASAQDGDATRPRNNNTASQLYSSSSQQSQTSFPYFRSRVSGNNGESMNNSTPRASSNDLVRGPPSGGGNPKSQKQVSGIPTTNSSLMNFSHFSRPVVLAKANFQNTGPRAGSGISSIERMGTKDKGLIPSNSKNAETVHIGAINGSQQNLSSHCRPVMLSSKGHAKPSDSMAAEEPLPVKQPEDMDQEHDSMNDKHHSQFAESATKRLADGEKTSEPIVASSSVCSGNSVERVSDEPTHNLKRKHREAEESEDPSEDVDEESIGGRKGAPARGGTGSKRSRAAEVHNLSERRRRDRINEKMRALQELIPNCNKVDKASMLDEAIEYLKTLQLQVQIMSMGAGLYMPSMMFPSGMHQMHPAHMAQFSPMGVGMGMGMGFGMGMPDMMGGSPGCSMIQVPPMHGAHFPGPPMSGPSALHAMGGSNMPMFGISSQGHPVPYPCPPLMPASGGPHSRTSLGLNAGVVAGPTDKLDSAPGSSSKDSVHYVNSQSIQNGGANGSINQTSGQCQVPNECFEQSTLAQNSVQASEVTESGAPKSAGGNDNVPSGAGGKFAFATKTSHTCQLRRGSFNVV